MAAVPFWSSTPQNELMAALTQPRPTADIQPTHQTPPLSPLLVGLLATNAGAAVASLYYSQPMLGVLGSSLHASERVLGWVPTLTQLGYAAGILLLAPLGDRLDRKKIIIAKGVALILSLLLAAIAPTISVLLVASFAIGLSATMAQDVVPAAATLAPESSRGKVVGTVMTGLLLGILLSRVVSGAVAEWFGWRVMFVSAAASIALVWGALWRKLPSFKPTTTVAYRELLGSLGQLWQRYPSLRQAAVAQGLLSIGFSAFWSTLALMLHGAPFHIGSAGAGAFGLAGAAGALAAPVAGLVADKRGPGLVTRIGAGLVMATFAAMSLVHFQSPQAQLIFLAASAVVFDLGIQASLIAHQTIIYSIDAGARSRLNAVLFVGVFVGMAIGSAVGGMLFAQYGWNSVSILAFGTALVALAIRLRSRR